MHCLRRPIRHQLAHLALPALQVVVQQRLVQRPASGVLDEGESNPTRYCGQPGVVYHGEASLPN